MRFSTIASCIVGSLAVASALPADAKAVNNNQKDVNNLKEQELRTNARALLDKALKEQKVAIPGKKNPGLNFAVLKSKAREEENSLEPTTFYRDEITKEQHKHLLDAFEEILSQDDEKKAEAQVTASVLAYLNNFLQADDEENQDRKTMNVIKHLLALQSEQAHSINVPLPQLVAAKGGAKVEGQIGTAYDADQQQQQQQNKQGGGDKNTISGGDGKKETYEKLIQNLDAQLDEIKEAAKEKNELEKLRETYTQKMKEVEEALKVKCDKEKKDAEQQPQPEQ